MKGSFRKMTMTVVAVALAFTAMAPVAAQPGPKGPRTGPYSEMGRGFDALMQKLDLSEGQEAQVRDALSEHRAGGRAWMQANPSATRAERQAFMGEHREALVATLSEILTAEQLATLEETFSAGRNAFGPRTDRRGFRGSDRMALMGRRLVQALELTDEQQEQLRALQAERRAEMLAWRDANPGATAEEMRAFRVKHWQEMQSALESVLTKDQLAELQERRESRRDRFEQRRNQRPRGMRGDAGPRGRIMN